MCSGGAGRADVPGPEKPSGLPPLSAPRIVVGKQAHRLTLYDGDRLIKSYRAAVGGGSGDKLREGDKCTPEGEFYVCVRNPQSQYVLSLGLSYPNGEDAARGLRDGLIDRKQHDDIVKAVRGKRQPPWNTPLGGEIMIHGCGASRDWTLGCVALEDDDIRELYPVIPVGTPVEIRP
jgi:murein L,D-transpeptidase YafK